VTEPMVSVYASATERTLDEVRDRLNAESSGRAVAESKLFILGAAISLGGLVSTQRASLQIQNPVGSAILLQVVGLTVYSTISQQILYIEDATMPGDSIEILAVNFNRANPVSAKVQGWYSTSAPTGGTEWSNQSRVFNTSPLPVKLPPLVLPPGKSLTIRGTTSDAQTFTANAYFIEEPID
jgi:hypothetical protein